MMAEMIAKDLSVRFPIGGGLRQMGKSLVRTAGGRMVASEDDSTRLKVEALKELSFTFKSGDRVGLVGHNGAGKSTLLQVLNGGIYPSSGTLDVDGRIMPLLNLGNGSDPEFSGYENITLLGLHLGLSRREIGERTDEIVEFTGLGNFIHLPLRSYSAGMHLRLMFSIATSVQPEILLIDELFGAGDQTFYLKAQERMTKLMENAGILVFASHAMGLIAEYCNRVLVMDQGQVLFDGDPKEGIKLYYARAAEV